VADLAHAARLDLELATVIATQPHVILLDEPSAGLDPDERRRTARHLRTMHAAIPRLGMLVV
jgi:ABC-type branched-subunit amino acid transport system ATPase component